LKAGNKYWAAFFYNNEADAKVANAAAKEKMK